MEQPGRVGSQVTSGFLTAVAFGEGGLPDELR